MRTPVRRASIKSPEAQMPASPTVEFVSFADIAGAGPAGAAEGASALIVLAGDNTAFGPQTQRLIAPAAQAIERAARAAKFKGKSGSTLDLLAPHGLGWDRLIVLGVAAKTDDSVSPSIRASAFSALSPFVAATYTVPSS